jgi:hypothetical protein
MRELRILAIAAALTLTFCRPADRPPLTPSSPTNPSMVALLVPPAQPAGEILDASIVTEGGTGWDAGPIYALDGGTGGPRPVR